MDLDRRWIILIGVIVSVALFAGGFLLGNLGGSSSEEAAEETTTTGASSSDPSSTTLGDPTDATLPEPDAADETIDPYGTEVERNEFVTAVRGSGIGGTNLDVLATGDEVCYHLERLEAQGRSAAYAVRVVWNEALAPIDSADLAAFGTVFVAAPHYLCPQSAAYAEEVSYWLGY